MALLEHTQTVLTRRHRELTRRIQALERDRRHTDAAVSADSADRAAERENDEVLDRLADATLVEIEQVQRALERIRSGRFGICERCERPIDELRLRAVPDATRCSVCAAAAMPPPGNAVPRAVQEQ
ncbi:MAG: TraR/DksA family transcriptional regulator [Gammaproteobacteria bacterium]|nr:TraR/DksA family transcriptional regulator [Gammaproteobacteria bacterium]